MKWTLKFAAILEIATGLALLLVPSLVAQLLLEVELAGVAFILARVAGIALLGLGVACWPGTPRNGMLIYGTLVTLYLAYLGFTGAATGILLWPTVGLHLVITLLLIWGRTSDNSR